VSTKTEFISVKFQKVQIKQLLSHPMIAHDHEKPQNHPAIIWVRTPREKESLRYGTVAATNLCVDLNRSTLVICVGVSSYSSNLHQDVPQFVLLESFFQPLRNEQTKRHPACC
jgi:hypothetical protein